VNGNTARHVYMNGKQGRQGQRGNNNETQTIVNPGWKLMISEFKHGTKFQNLGSHVEVTGMVAITQN